MKAFRLLLYCLCFFLGSLGQLLADEKEDALRMEEALKVISDPNVYGELKHQAMVVLQELKDPSSIEALYEEIGFVSAWGSQRQRSTQNSYPATRALILIGEPSIEGAEQYLKSKQSKNNTELFLVSHVIYEIFRIKNDETYGAKFPKTDVMLLEWQKENYSLEQLKILSGNYYFPVLKVHLEALPNSPVIPATKISAAKTPESRDDGEENSDQRQSDLYAERPSEALPKQNRDKSFWSLMVGVTIVTVIFVSFKIWRGRHSS